MRQLLLALACSGFMVGCVTPGGRIGVGIQIGEPPPPRTFVVPGRPGPDFVWVDGYWYPVGSQWEWHDGYWTRPPYAGAYWVEPYYVEGRYFGGHWDGNRGRFEHDHRWDRSRERDEGRRR